MRRPPLFLGALLASSVLAACAATTPDPGPDDAGSTSAMAVVAVERTVGPGDTVRGDTVLARFVRVRPGPRSRGEDQGAVDDAALRVAGIAADVPAPGACIAPTEAASASLAGRGVELLDVGQINVASAVLLPRTMPDPAGVVSGVFYSTRSVDAFAAGGKVALRSTGGADLDGFALSATAPREISDVRVLPLVGGLDVSWDAEDARDVFYVDVLAPSARVIVRCTAAESGRVVVPYVGADDGQVVVHRLHREAFKAKGIETGEIRFDLAKIVSFRR